MRAFRHLSAAILAAALSAAALAQKPAVETATITGKVSTPDGTPITDAVVTLLELRKSVSAGSDGTFRFDAVRPGHYHIQAESRRFGSAIGEADLAAGATRAVDIVLDPAVHREEVVVSASPESRSATEVYQPVAVVNDQEISEALKPSLGETLEKQPGVSSTYFGPGSSRPVIRGLGSDRIRILEDGVSAGDASNVSEDHAVSIDPATAQQIEIVRGPATLLYGSSAVGGVVNVLSDRIPDRIPTQPVTGTVDLRFGTGADEKNGSFSLGGGLGTLAWHADFTGRTTHDLDIPGPAEAHAEEGAEAADTGKLENSSLEALSGTLGLSYVGARGFFGVSYNGLDTQYGIPGDEEERVRIDLQQRRFDVKGELRELGFLRSVKARLGVSNYEHKELEGEEIGTIFKNDGFEGRVEAVHEPLGPLTGSLGVQIARSDFEAIGEEAFLLPNVTTSQAFFVFEEVKGERWDLQFGGRFEHQSVEVDRDARPGRSFNGVSGSLGTIFRPADGWALALSLARAERLPTSTELYAEGPHVATRQFEVGDIDLGKEKSLGIDLSVRRTAGRVRGTFNLFMNRFSDFIYGEATGEEEEGLPVFQFVQRDARFWGMELDTHTEVWHSGETHLELELGADFVRAELSAGGGDLPRIPPFRASAGVRLESGPFSAMTEVRRTFRQKRVAAHEDPTDGYTFLNAMLRCRLFSGTLVHDLFARGTNLTNELARNHVSPLKDLAPLPGRDFTFGYRLAF
jgi:iron complex outermembrane recepter protein